MSKQNPYALTEAQVEALASQRCTQSLETDRADGTYLRALITATQSKLGPPRRGRAPRQLEVLATVSDVFYAAVLRGVTTPDIEITTGLEAAEVTRRTRERNRRATFARSAKSTLVAWCEAGGDVRDISVATITKAELRRGVSASKSPTETEERAIDRAQARIMASIAHQARASPDLARAKLESVITALTAVLEELPETEEHGATTTVARTRVGTPTWRPEARVLNRGASP